MTQWNTKEEGERASSIPQQDYGTQQVLRKRIKVSYEQIQHLIDSDQESAKQVIDPTAQVSSSENRVSTKQEGKEDGRNTTIQSVNNAHRILKCLPSEIIVMLMEEHLSLNDIVTMSTFNKTSFNHLKAIQCKKNMSLTINQTKSGIISSLVLENDDFKVQRFKYCYYSHTVNSITLTADNPEVQELRISHLYAILISFKMLKTISIQHIKVYEVLKMVTNVTNGLFIAVPLETYWEWMDALTLIKNITDTNTVIGAITPHHQHDDSVTEEISYTISVLKSLEDKPRSVIISNRRNHYYKTPPPGWKKIWLATHSKQSIGFRWNIGFEIWYQLL